MTEGVLPWRTNVVPIAEELEDAELDVAPPAYGEHHDQLQFSQAGFSADAAVTADGRVNINISEKNRRLSELLAPALQRQLRSEAQLPSGPLPPPYIPPNLGGLPGQTPPPRLNVVIQIVGSRGDVQPFVALGQVLRDTYGHRVRLATHATFRSFVEENGLEFFNIGGDPAELMAFMVKNPGLMPGLDALKSGEIKKRRREIQEILMGCWRSCIEAGDGMGVPPPPHARNEPVDERFVMLGDPRNRPFVADAIIANPPSFAHIHIAEKLGIPLHMMFTMPWTPTRAFPHPLADIVSTNTDVALANYVSYALVDMMTWQGLGDMINRFRTNILELEPLSLIWAPGLLSRLRVPATYCWSPALTPKPADWAPEVTVSGFYFLDLESNYSPDPELSVFLQAGPPPVYIGFGSIVVDDPDALTQTIFRAIIKAGVRAIVSKGWGGLGGDASGVPEGVFMLGSCPHDWLFQRVSAVVHHGGAGTTAAGIRAGKPTVVVPFFGDQIFWGSMVAKAGAGPAPIPYKKLTAENLAAAIDEALRPETRAKARELGEKIKQEKGADVGGKSFHQFLNTDNMRCSLAPSRVAVWRVRRSKIRLSALAAAVLVKEGLLKYSDLKLYRPVEYNTEEQPWDPISAVILTFLGDVSALTMAVADFPREIFRGAHGKKNSVNADREEGGPDNRSEGSTSTSGVLAAASSSSPQRGSSHAEPVGLSSPTTTSAYDSAETLVSPLASPNQNISSQQTRTSITSDPLRSQSPPNHEGPSTPSTSEITPVNLDMAFAAGRGVARILGAGFKMPNNFCLGLARGFRNAPKLYNDETVRPAEKVTGIVSGMKVAGKEFGLGMYDGLSGLLTHPWKGAEKEGRKGLLKGVGKGIGGLILKPAAAFWSLPAYTMQGVHAELRNLFARSSTNYIITSRVLQGEEDLAFSTTEERQDILVRWQARKDDLKGFYLLKQREREKAKEVEAALAAAATTGNLQEQRQQGRGSVTGGYDDRPSSRSGWWRMQREAWNNRQAESGSSAADIRAGPPPPTTASSASSNSTFEDNESLERAIQQSIEQTSRGDREEDARIEAAVRASVMEMRRMAELQSRGYHGGPGNGNWVPDQKVAQPHPEGEAGSADSDWTNITDEEYQALIEEAVRQSLLQQHIEEESRRLNYQQFEGEGLGRGVRTHELRQPLVSELPGDFEFPSAKAGELGKGAGAGAGARVEVAGAAVDDEDEQLRRALEESEREQRERAEQAARQRSEEEIVLEYVKRQSLAEEEYRRAMKARKGKATSRTGVDDDGDAEDEDLRRALEESLRMSSGGGGAGPSRS